MSDEVKIKSNEEVDKGLVAMFLKLTPEERLKANDNAVRAIMEMRNAFRDKKVHVLDIEKIIELKETSNDPKDRQRLPLLRETLRQLQNDK